MVDVFVHIHKTGGTTLNNQILRHNYAPSEILDLHRPLTAEASARIFNELPTEKQCATRLITGHFDFGIHAYIGRPCRYFALLRNPVARVISLYYFIRQTWLGGVFLRTRGYNTEDVESLSLKEFIEAGLFSEVDNGQTRMISGLGSEVPYGACTSYMLHHAIENIENHFSVVGVTEQFDESLILMVDHHEWSRLLYARTNVNKSKPKRDRIPEEDIEAVQAYNELDLELYDYVSRRLKQRLERRQGIAKKLSLFRFVNQNIYQPYRGLINRARQFKHQLWNPQDGG
jgi:hypothetical protein